MTVAPERLARWLAGFTERHGEPATLVGADVVALTGADGDRAWVHVPWPPLAELTVDALLEHAEFAGNHYGTPRSPVLKHLAAGVPTLLEIELEGARQVRHSMPDARFVFLAPPSPAELVHRLSGRGTESADALRARLARAEVELAAASEFDHVVVNERLEDAARQVAELLG